ncbi:MAG: 16S rRNA (guanine(527)-N(7))-methyltransferase RsmG [Chakrabartia sp.]
MTEDEAKAWLLETRGVSRETFDKLDGLRHLVLAESLQQNLISAASADQMWARHIVDSAQLIPLAGANKGPWLDLGTGAGFPGLVVAILESRPVILVESRRKRVEFLKSVADTLDLKNVILHGGRLEHLSDRPASVISARAFAPLPKLLDAAFRYSRNGTVWVLPKGRSAREELETITHSWQGVFHVEQSITDTDAAIIVARDVKRKRAR